MNRRIECFASRTPSKAPLRSDWNTINHSGEKPADAAGALS